MHKKLSLLLTILLLHTFCFAQEIIPLDMLIQKIEQNFVQVSQYLTRPLSSPQQQELMKVISADERSIQLSLETYFHNPATRNELLRLAEWYEYQESGQYIANTIRQIESGSLAKTTAERLLDIPELRFSTIHEMLRLSSSDFKLLTQRVQQALGLSHEKALSLVLAAEIEYADAKISREISSLRNTIKYCKSILKRNYFSYHSPEGEYYKKKIQKANREITKLMQERQMLRKDYSNAFGHKEANELFKELSSVSTADLMKHQSYIYKNFSKRIRKILPMAVGIGIFTTVFQAQASANNHMDNQIIDEMSQALNEHISLKQEILEGLTQNPEYIGLFYAGGEKSREVLLQLLENEGPNSLDTEELLPYAADWQDRLYELLNDKNSFYEYLEVLKEIYHFSDAEEVTKTLQNHFQAAADHTRVAYPPQMVLR